MPAAIRSFAGHFAPHVALTLFLLAIASLLPTFFTDGVGTALAAPTWRTAAIVTTTMMVGFCAYLALRYYHDRHQCNRCDHNGATDRYRLAPMGFLARHWHWCRTMPGIWIYVVVWLLTMLLSILSSIGTVLIYAGMALWAASTIAHQARIRSCPSHTSTIMYNPPHKWFSAEQILAELHYRARGIDQIHLTCERYACGEATTVASPEAAVIWTLAHSDVHLFKPLHSPMVVLQVTLDPHLELDALHV